MRAVTCTGGDLRVEDLEDLTPGPGQLLVQVLRCGIMWFGPARPHPLRRARRSDQRRRLRRHLPLQARAINKEIDLRFVLGYTPRDFRDALHLLADGKVSGEPVVTGVVGFDGVAGAFDVLASADEHAKILIDPASRTTKPVPR